MGIFFDKPPSLFGLFNRPVLGVSHGTPSGAVPDPLPPGPDVGELIAVIFVERFSPWQVGETAGFTKPRADWLVRKGFARRVED